MNDRKNKNNKHNSSSNNSHSLWLYGKHPTLLALANKNRLCHEILVTQTTYDKLKNELPTNVKLSVVNKETLESKVNKDAVHQGIIVRVSPLPILNLEDITLDGPIVILDQVTDPHNIGAILRNCAAFDIKNIIVTKNNSPYESAVLAKSSSGALEKVNIIRVTNLDRTIEKLKEQGYWCYGLAADTKLSIRQMKFSSKTALIFGAEGSGLRNLTSKRCDEIIKIPMSNNVESFNITNAVAITLYELHIQLSN